VESFVVCGKFVVCFCGLWFYFVVCGFILWFVVFFCGLWFCFVVCGFVLWFVVSVEFL
jgi:hypothetical protein